MKIDSNNKIQQRFQEASDCFQLGQVVKVEKASGNMNKSYTVITNSGDQFIFRTPVKHSLKDFEAEIIYLDRLREYNFPAAYYIKGSHGSPIFQYGDNVSDILVVQPKLKGTHPSFTQNVCFSIGQNIAKLHQISTRNLPQRDHWLRESFLSENISLIQSHFPQKAQKFTDAFDSLANFQYSVLPKTIVHGDLYSSNCLYDNDDLIVILDWEEVGVAPAVLDLATCIWNFCFEDDSFNPSLFQPMIDGYQRMRSLNKLERESLSLGVKYAGLTLSAWRLVQFGLYTPDPVIEKRSEIYWKTGLDKLTLPVI